MQLVIWHAAGLNKPLTTLCKHGQKEEEAYTKKTISTHNWRVAKELAVFEGAQSFSHPIISKIY